jgi:hypothetical protein
MDLFTDIMAHFPSFGKPRRRTRELVLVALRQQVAASTKALRMKRLFRQACLVVPESKSW